MAFYGLDIEQVQQFATLTKQKSSDITQMSSEITSKLEGTQWEGPDATQFRSDWTQVHVPALRQIAEALETVSTTAAQNASEQEQASA